MSCPRCEEAQEMGMTAAFRWKNANIEIRGCEDHLREVLEILREAQVERCPAHDDGKHIFVECDEWGATCVCGKPQSES